jgi:hypothetical protein
MIEGGCCLCFLAEASLAIGVVHTARPQNLQSNVTSDRGVASPIDLTHSPRAKNGKDFVRTEYCARGQRHCWAAL